MRQAAHESSLRDYAITQLGTIALSRPVYTVDKTRSSAIAKKQCVCYAYAFRSSPLNRLYKRNLRPLLARLEFIVSAKA